MAGVRQEIRQPEGTNLYRWLESVKEFGEADVVEIHYRKDGSRYGVLVRWVEGAECQSAFASSM